MDNNLIKDTDIEKEIQVFQSENDLLKFITEYQPAGKLVFILIIIETHYGIVNNEKD